MLRVLVVLLPERQFGVPPLSYQTSNASAKSAMPVVEGEDEDGAVGVVTGDGGTDLGSPTEMGTAGASASIVVEEQVRRRPAFAPLPIR